MLRIIQNSTAEGAKSYYSTADYYTEGQELVGEWRGKAAERLALSGTVDKGDWDALCDNRHPETGERLTARQRANRRVGYDINFHVPKSVSVLFGLTEDEQILDAFKGAVNETMRDIEAEVGTRVRIGGKDEDRTTGNLVWGEFVHFTARPVDGVPDPHLHAHCFAFNATWDGSEERWKAAQFAGLKRDAPYFEALFHSRLAQRMQELGYPIERTPNGWDVAGVPGSVVAKFSRRTHQIDEKARERGIQDPATKSELGATTRARKKTNLTMDELRSAWWARLTDSEKTSIAKVTETREFDSRGDASLAAQLAVDFAVAHSFERQAVVPERRLLTTAMRHAYGVASARDVSSELSAAGLLAGERNGVRLVTTRPVLEEEGEMLAFAREGRGTCMPLGNGEHVFECEWLNDGQRRAVEQVLGSRDRVMVVRGGAGTGKTSMMKEAVAGVEAGGHHVLVFAPSAEASRGVLRAEGFQEAETVARLLLDNRLQRRARGQVIWVDEAGLLGSRTMAKLFKLAGELDARVVLSGDRRQHGSVERGGPLALLEDEAGLVPAEIKDIQRQRGAYKEAVRMLSEGRTAAGFGKLDALGWIRSVPDTERDTALAREFVESVGQGKTALVVSPTHREGERITREIRDSLRASGRIDGEEREFVALKARNLTEAERGDVGSYVDGDVLVFHQNAKGHTRGDRVILSGADRTPVDQAARYQVFRSGTLAVAPGDILRVTRNGKTADGKHRLNNGQLVTVRRFTDDGDIVLTNGWTVARDYGHLTHGYVVTSHASQGKTVDRVFIGQSSDSLGASSAEQFYVSVSRGREQATIFTDDKTRLLQGITRSDDRMSATELLRERTAHLARSALIDGALTEREWGAAHVRG